MGEQIKQILEQAEQAIAGCVDELSLQLLESRFIGRKSQLAGLINNLGQLSPEERKTAGMLLNQAKQEITEQIQKKRAELSAIRQKMATSRDVTLPGIKPEIGHLSPLTYINRELVDIFKELGYEVVDGPEAETETNNFDLLNIPANHPARDQWDTFWLKQEPDGNNNTLLRTHTSPVQIRYMQTHPPPIRIISPGRAFRYEAEDATHSSVFSQIEGLMIDKDINVAHLKATMLHFVRRILGEKHNIRLRPSFFPFTEPSFEVDISCGLCDGKGCKSCSHKGWLELMGAGMVHPQVLRNVGIDPEVYSGFAFGAGIERLTMLKYGITDIRLFLSGDMRFIKQF